MRDLRFALVLALVGCGSREPAPPPNVAVVPIAPVAPQPPNAPNARSAPNAPPPPPNVGATAASTLSGTIGGQRFAAQSALLVRVNESADSSSSVFPGQVFPITWSFLLVFERPLGCADVGKNMLPKSGAAERYLRFQVQGRWPIAAGRSFDVGSDPQHPAADGISGNVWRGQSGSILRGTVRVAAASTTNGTLDMELTTATSGTDTSGALRGTAAVTVCP